MEIEFQKKLTQLIRTNRISGECHGERLHRYEYLSRQVLKFIITNWITSSIFQNGINHLFVQGQNLRNLYVSTGFLNGSYDSEEVIFNIGFQWIIQFVDYDPIG